MMMEHYGICCFTTKPAEAEGLAQRYTCKNTMHLMQGESMPQISLMPL